LADLHLEGGCLVGRGPRDDLGDCLVGQGPRDDLSLVANVSQTLRGRGPPAGCSPAEVTDNFLNQQNAAINNAAFCPLADVANASSSIGAGKVTVRFYRLSPPDGEIVESIVLDGHRLGYGAIPGYYGLHYGGMFGGAVLGKRSWHSAGAGKFASRMSTWNGLGSRSLTTAGDKR
jgi:hypothetical protein